MKVVTILAVVLAGGGLLYWLSQRGKPGVAVTKEGIFAVPIPLLSRAIYSTAQKQMDTAISRYGG